MENAKATSVAATPITATATAWRIPGWRDQLLREVTTAAV
jgi:hypothetical protein